MTDAVRSYSNADLYKDASAIVEFQAFRGNDGKFIIKELVILNLSTGVQDYFLFKPPFHFSNLIDKAIKTNSWCTRNHHHISWDEGFTPYEEIDTIMYQYCSIYKTIFSTGLEKCNWIRLYTKSTVIELNISKEVTAMDNNLCVSVRNPLHKSSNCALLRAYCLSLTLDKHLFTVSNECGGGSACGGERSYKGGERATSTYEFYSNRREGRSPVAQFTAITHNHRNTMSAQRLQELADLFNKHSKSSVLATKKCSELKEERRYTIHGFKRIDTSVGDGILAALSEAPYRDGDLAKFQVFLPKRFVSLLQNEDIDSIPSGKMYLVSHGSSGNNSTELSLHAYDS